LIGGSKIFGKPNDLWFDRLKIFGKQTGLGFIGQRLVYKQKKDRP
jgi:hypothetical protein